MSSHGMPACANWRKGGSGETGQPPARRKGSRVLGGCLFGLRGSWLYPLVSTDFGQLSASPKASLSLGFPTLATNLGQDTLVDRCHLPLYSAEPSPDLRTECQSFYVCCVFPGHSDCSLSSPISSISL